MGLLEGKIAVITGGTRGLGLGIAGAYARAGATVVVASRSAGSVEAAVKQLRDSGAQASGCTCDVGSLRDVEALAAHAIDTFGRFDIWVNNAGLSAPYGPTSEVSIDNFVRVVQTNILGTYYGSIVALQQLLPKRSGKLINLLGRGDKEVVPLQNAYASSKAWVRQFTLALAKECKGSGVDVFAFNPGLVQTELMSQVEAVPGYEDRLQPLETVMRMWSNPVDVPARKAVWLASAASDGRNGLEARQLNTARIITGLLGEGMRRLLRRPAQPYALQVTTQRPG